MLVKGAPYICNNQDDGTCEHVIGVLGVRDYYHIVCKTYCRRLQNIWETSTYATVYYDMYLVDAIYLACWQIDSSADKPRVYLFDVHMPNSQIKCLINLLNFFDDTYTWKKSEHPFHLLHTKHLLVVQPSTCKWKNKIAASTKHAIQWLIACSYRVWELEACIQPSRWIT